MLSFIRVAMVVASVHRNRTMTKPELVLVGEQSGKKAAVSEAAQTTGMLPGLGRRNRGQCCSSESRSLEAQGWGPGSPSSNTASSMFIRPPSTLVRVGGWLNAAFPIQHVYGGTQRISFLIWSEDYIFRDSLVYWSVVNIFKDSLCPFLLCDQWQVISLSHSIWKTQTVSLYRYLDR